MSWGAVGDVGPDDVHLDVVAGLEVLGGLFGVRLVLEELVVGQHALDLGADVDDDAFLRQHDDLAGGDHAAVNGLACQQLVAGGEHVLHADLVFGSGGRGGRGLYGRGGRGDRSLRGHGGWGGTSVYSLGGNLGG